MNTDDAPARFPSLEWFCAYATFSDEVCAQMEADMRRTATVDAKQVAADAIARAASTDN